MRGLLIILCKDQITIKKTCLVPANFPIFQPLSSSELSDLISTVLNMQSFILRVMLMGNSVVKSQNRISLGQEATEKMLAEIGDSLVQVVNQELPPAEFMFSTAQHFLKRRMDCFYPPCPRAFVWGESRRLPHCSGDWCCETELDGMYCMGGQSSSLSFVHTRFMC